MSDDVKVREIELPTEHDAQKWIVLEAYVDGVPQVTKRVTINTYALADGTATLEAVEAKLVDTVREYKARWDAVNAAREARKPKPDKPDKPKGSEK